MKIITGGLAAIALVACAFVAIHIFNGNSLFWNNPLGDVPTMELIENAQGKASLNRIDSVIELGRRPQHLDETFSVLAQLAISEEEKLKVAADTALANLGDKAVSYVEPYFESGEPADYRMACAAIRSIGPSAKVYLPQIEKLIADEDVMLRRCGLFSLQGMGDESLPLLDDVINCLKDEDFNNQCMACRVLEPLGNKAKGAETALINLLEDGIPSTRSLAAKCLASIELEPDSRDKVIKIIKEIMSGERSKLVADIERDRYKEVLISLGAN